jgi:hypothetical protein
LEKEQSVARALREQKEVLEKQSPVNRALLEVLKEQIEQQNLRIKLIMDKDEIHEDNEVI